MMSSEAKHILETEEMVSVAMDESQYARDQLRKAQQENTELKEDLINVYSEYLANEAGDIWLTLIYFTYSG